MSVDDDDDATVNSTEGRLGRVFLPLVELDSTPLENLHLWVSSRNVSSQITPRKKPTNPNQQG